MVIIEEVTRLGPERFRCRITRNNQSHFIIAAIETCGAIPLMTISSEEPGLMSRFYRDGEYHPLQQALRDLLHGRPFPLPLSVGADGDHAGQGPSENRGGSG